MSHPLHRRVSHLIVDALKDAHGLRIVTDPACTEIEDKSLQQVPLFCTADKKRRTRYSCVDLLILQDDKVRVILEIEESDIKPTQICGKFLTAALSNFYIHEIDGDPKGMADDVTFIQVLDSSKLKERSVKLHQFRHLEESIQHILPLKGSRISRYCLFTGKEGDHFTDMVSIIKTDLGHRSDEKRS